MSNELHFSISISSNNRSIVATNDFPVYQNEITFLFGESGIGKSIISKGLYGLLNPEELEVTINQKSYQQHCTNNWTKYIRKNGFFVFQEPSSHLNPLMTIKEQLNEGSLNDSDDTDILRYLWQTTDDAAVRKIIELYPKPYRPSGGEKQRILLVMAFKRINSYLEKKINEPAWFIFDEPTGSLDNNYRNRFIELLFAKYNARPFTTTIITHDYSIISEIYRNHRHLISKIHFKELSRSTEPYVEIKDFSAQEYLNWLHITSSNKAGRISEEAVLQFDSRFSIFGRKLCIFRDETRRYPTALTIRKGDIAYIKAPSGVGKTTLAKIIMGLYRADRFSMKLSDISITENTPEIIYHNKIWGKKAGMIFQHADEALNMQATVIETFKALPLKKKITTDNIRMHLTELFSESTLTEQFIRKKVAFLSGGQKQRLNLLRTLALAPQLIILDEPLNGLDFNSVKKVLSLLNLKRSQGSALLMISHNEEIFENFIEQENIYYLSEI